MLLNETLFGLFPPLPRPSFSSFCWASTPAPDNDIHHAKRPAYCRIPLRHSFIIGRHYGDGLVFVDSTPSRLPLLHPHIWIVIISVVVLLLTICKCPPK